MRRSPSRQPGDEGESGFTLIELSIAAGLMALVAILVSTTVIGGIRTAARSEKRTDDASASQIALLQLNADIRAADDVLLATPDQLTVTTRSRGTATTAPDAATETVEYAVTGGALQVRRYPTGGTRPAAATTVLPAVAPSATAGRAVFTYLAQADVKNQCTTGPTVGTLGATVASADLKNVYSVEVWLSVNRAPQVNSRPLVLSGGAVISSRVADFGSVALPTASTLGIGQGCS